MSRLSFTQLILPITLLLLMSPNLLAQEATVTIEQDENIEKLLKERKRLLKKGELVNHYAIQVISASEIKTARTVLAECKSSFKEYKSDIVYQTPHYKVWIGKFRNRLDADAALVKISEEYSGAFIFKPEGKKEES